MAYCVAVASFGLSLLLFSCEPNKIANIIVKTNSASSSSNETVGCYTKKPTRRSLPPPFSLSSQTHSRAFAVSDTTTNPLELPSGICPLLAERVRRGERLNLLPISLSVTFGFPPLQSFHPSSPSINFRPRREIIIICYV